MIALSWGSWGCRKVTLMPHPLKWPPQAFWGAFPFAVWKNWKGGIHEPTAQRKEHSKTEFGKKNFEEKFRESETFYRSKFRRATGVTVPGSSSSSWGFFESTDLRQREPILNQHLNYVAGYIQQSPPLALRTDPAINAVDILLQGQVTFFLLWSAT